MQYSWEKIENLSVKINRELINKYRLECSAKFFENGLIQNIPPKIVDKDIYPDYICSCGYKIKLINRDIQICPSCELPIKYDAVDDFYELKVKVV
jgi:hypothetical protein